MGFFAVFVGGTFMKIQGTCIIQPAVQRFLSLPGMKEVKQSLFAFIIGLVCLLSLCIYLGLLAFASYYDCDPISTGVSSIFRFLFLCVLVLPDCLIAVGTSQRSNSSLVCYGNSRFCAWCSGSICFRGI